MEEGRRRGNHCVPERVGRRARHDTPPRERLTMFLLLAGPGIAAADGALETMAAKLRGGPGEPRLWRDGEGKAAAAALAPDFVPEDAFDAQPLAGAKRLFVCQARIDNRGELLDRLGLAADAPIADQRP